jgi:hypothetical protein
MTAGTEERLRPRLLPRIGVAVAFLLAFLWQLYGAVSNLLAWTGFAVAAGGQLTVTAWVILILGIAIPLVTFVVGLILGRRRPAGVLALVLVLALVASEALSLSQYALFLGVIGAL